ncbi:MAG: M48 family metallopeptidase [Thiomicrorhabdus sp.]|nr:M48 family metallopeptidase [Thiomicrorhabdus sp.]
MFSLKALKDRTFPDFPDVYQFGDYCLPIVFSARRKSIALKHKQGQLLLEVPKAIKASQLNRVLQDNQQWFLRRIEKLSESQVTVFSGQPGETFTLFGNRYQCVWQTSANPLNLKQQAIEPIQLCDITQCANVYLANHLSEQQKAVNCCQTIVDFFAQNAYQYLLPKLDFYAELMGVQYQSLTVKGYKSRWGSCYSDGRIQFNWRLMQAPEWVIDYVVVHELAHLVHANHSQAFWNLVEQHYPKTKQAKKVLKTHGRQWIEFLQK